MLLIYNIYTLKSVNFTFKALLTSKFISHAWSNVYDVYCPPIAKMMIKALRIDIGK